MIIDNSEQHVKGAYGLGEQKSFAIRTNAHAFKLLSSGLYSDKISAVLREIGCNATDAHIEYGTPDEPIIVKLPNKIDNQFYIRDMGPGLKHEDVMELYTTYFASTKQQSNDFTGAFGLGSKSPFSYVDSFTVTSVYMGTMRTYSAHLDNTGSPTIALLTTEKADPSWTHGVQIGFAVKPGDYPYFHQKAQQVFQWFKVTPRIEGAAPIKKMSFNYEDNLFAYGPEISSHGVLMGNVHYRFDINKLEGITLRAKIMQAFPNVVLKLPIGSVQVAASREELQYDKPSMKVLIKACEDVAMVIAEDAKHAAEKFSNASWEDKCKIKEVKTRWEVANHVNWADVLHRAGYTNASQLADVIGKRAIQLSNKAGRIANFRVITPSHRNNVLQYTKVKNGQKADYSYASPVSVEIKEKSFIVYGKAKNSMLRARAAILRGDVQQMLLITPTQTDTTEDAAKKEAEECSKFLSNMPMMHISGLDAPPTASKPKKAKHAHKAPLPSTIVHVMDLKGITNSVDIVTISDKHYMCRSAAYDTYYGTKGVRVYIESAEKDPAYDKNSWMDILQSLDVLQDELKVKVISEVPFIPASVIKQLDLPKRGWVASSVVMEQWLRDPKTKAAVEAIANGWTPTVKLDSLPITWVGYMISTINVNRPAYDIVRPVLQSAGIDQQIMDIYTASKKAGKLAGSNDPPAVLAYNRLQGHFKLDPLKVTKRVFVTVAELDSQLQKKYPMLTKFRPDSLWELRHFPSKMTEFARLLFT